MKVALFVWAVALFFVWLVIGRSVDQVLLATKIGFVGFFGGVLGQKLCDVIQVARNVNTRVSSHSKLHR